MSIKKIAILVMIGVGVLTTIIAVPIVVLSNKEDQKDSPKNIKIKEMQKSLNNLNLILPKGKDYSDETKILRAIKTALETRTNIDASHTTFITSKTSVNNKISLVAIHSATPILFTIVVGDREFILKLNQAQYTLDEASKINKLKASLSNLKVMLPKNGNYRNETQIFKAIKIKLETREGIDASHTVFATSKTSANSKISSVAIYGAAPTQFIIIVGDQEFILQLNQAQYSSNEITKINELKASLNNNLKVILPKSKDYSSESRIFEAVKTSLKTRDGIDDSHIAFITSKPLANSGISLVAAHGATSTQFTIVVDNQEFVLELNQAKYTLDEASKINTLKDSLKNLKVILPKGENYPNELSIFIAINIALKTRTNLDDWHIPFITSKTSANSGIASVAAHGESPTQFIVIVDAQEFVLELNQAEYTIEEIKINKMNASLSDLNLILPNDGNYGDEIKILEAIKIVLQKREGIDASHTTFITSKTSANSGVSSIATHEATPTPFTINVGDQEFVLKLKLSPFTLEQTKINELKASFNNLKLILPKGEDYSSESLIFEAIKIALKARVGIDDSHLAFITSKPLANSGISSVAKHGATSTPFIVIANGEEFILQLNQAQYLLNEMIKIIEMQDTINLSNKIIVPQSENYNSEVLILEAVKKVLKARFAIDDSHIALITSKTTANSGIASVAEHGEMSTQFTIVFIDQEFILELNQSEKTKIGELKESLSNLKVTLPKDDNYSDASLIFEAVKTALKTREKINDGHIALMTSKTSANSRITSVAAHAETPTQFTIIVDGEEFILELNQSQFTLEQNKINYLKGIFKHEYARSLIIPKGGDYSNESLIFEAAKTALKTRAIINDSHFAFITSKTSHNSKFSSVPYWGQNAMQFIIVVDSEEFVLSLIQAEYTILEKFQQINKIKETIRANLNLIMSKKNYDNFHSIKLEFYEQLYQKDIPLDISNRFELKGSVITQIAPHGATPTLFPIAYGGEYFVFKLNQAE